MSVKFSNNAETILSSGINNSVTAIAVANGAVFPTLTATDYFYATLEDAGNSQREVIKVTARSGNTLTATRAQDGTSALAFSSGDKVELRLNAAALTDAASNPALTAQVTALEDEVILELGVI
jgi:hypothetical protein